MEEAGNISAIPLIKLTELRSVGACTLQVYPTARNPIAPTDKFPSANSGIIARQSHSLLIQRSDLSCITSRHLDTAPSCNNRFCFFYSFFNLHSQHHGQTRRWRRPSWRWRRKHLWRRCAQGCATTTAPTTPHTTSSSGSNRTSSPGTYAFCW